MYRWMSAGIGILVSISPMASPAQEGDLPTGAPRIIPEQVQMLAVWEDVASQLEIDWKSATMEDVGRYADALVRASNAAEEIAETSIPEKVDYLAGIREAGFSVQVSFAPQQGQVIEQPHLNMSELLLEQPIVIIPEELQVLSIQHNIHEKFGIDWAEERDDKLGEYLSALAVASVVSSAIARRNGRSKPITEDYLAGLAVSCWWPPFKPPYLDEYREFLYPAFYSATTRELIRAEIGPLAFALPKEIFFREDNIWLPEDAKEFTELFFDISSFLEFAQRQ